MADDDLTARLVAYINYMELAVCGEWHTGGWPDDCDDRHDEGRALLAALATTQIDELRHRLAVAQSHNHLTGCTCDTKARDLLGPHLLERHYKDNQETENQ